MSRTTTSNIGDNRLSFLPLTSLTDLQRFKTREQCEEEDEEEDEDDKQTEVDDDDEVELDGEADVDEDDEDADEEAEEDSRRRRRGMCALGKWSRGDVFNDDDALGGF